MKPDIWAAREVKLGAEDKTTPVLVAIWDSGIDVSLFPDQLFTDSHPTVTGTHGLAYDEKGYPAKTWLYPMTAEHQRAYPGFRDEIKDFWIWKMASGGTRLRRPSKMLLTRFSWLRPGTVTAMPGLAEMFPLRCIGRT